MDPHRPAAAADGVAPPPASREPTEVSMTSQTPLIDVVAAPSSASAAPQGPGGPPRPMRGDSPADLLEEAFAPVLRSPGIGDYPRAEAFLGRAVELPRPPEIGAGPPGSAELRVSRWLLEQRRVDTALRYLSRSGAGTSLDIGVVRLRCLVALRRFPAASEELSRLKELAGGSAALPFEASVLSAELPWLLDATDGVRALGQLQELARRARTRTIGDVALGERLHLMQVLSHVALKAGHGSAAADEISAALRAEEEEPSRGGGEGSGEPAGTPPARARLLSLLGRHLAHEGDTRAAAEAFERARSAGLQEDSAAAQMDRGILCVAQGDYAHARAHFVAASAAALAGVGPGGGLTELAPAAIDEAVAAENNLAVCRFYTKELVEGVKGLEAFVRRSPVLFLQPCVIQSLCSLYEFMTDGGQRRVTLKDIVSAFQLEDIEPRCFDQQTG